jgi:molybdate/tungstate transport system substrate-binding protein
MWTLAEELNFSDLSKDDYYHRHAVVVLPGLGTPQSARTIAVPGARLMWGITMLKDAPHKQNAIKFLELLLSPAGTAALKEYGPGPISPAFVNPSDVAKLPESLWAWVRTTP